MNTPYQTASATEPPREIAAGTAGDIIRIFSQPGEVFSDLEGLTAWLKSKGVDCVAADSRKGLAKLLEKIEKGEAKLVYNELTHQVVRVARAARIDVEVTIRGVQYPLVELCQIFLDQKIAPEDLYTTNPANVSEVLGRLKIRSAQVRDSQQLWETLVPDEDPELGARRGLVEELHISEKDALAARLTLGQSTIEYEAPIDWPGIHSVLETQRATAVLPEEMSKPVYAELEAGDQITIFVATPNAPVLKALLGAVIPKIKYVP